MTTTTRRALSTSRRKADAIKTKTRQVYKKLKTRHADAQIELNFKNPLELLIATVLSAQCTDVRVNQVTETLFKKYKTPEDYLRDSQEALEEVIRSTGFFRQKAKSIRGAMKAIVEYYGGEVPKTMEELTKLPGVGRKTANVVLGNGFGIPGLPVDTHVRRLCNRFGLTKSDDPVQIEKELCAMLPKKDWTMFSHTLIFHGRRVCKARRPDCSSCTATSLCDYYATQVER